MLNTSNAFVGSDLDNPNFMEVLGRVEEYESIRNSTSYALELQKSLYRLRQSKLWHQKVKSFLLRNGFRGSLADSSVFFNERGIISAVYIDYILVFGKSEQDIELVKRKFKDFHLMKDFGHQGPSSMLTRT